MTHPDTLPIRRDDLLAATVRYVSPERQAEFLNAAVFGIDALPATDEAANSSELEDDAVRSFPLSVDHARDLKARLDDKSVEMIRAMVTSAVEDVATINWLDVKAVTGVRDWSSFARGRLGGIHRSLRNMLGVPKNAILIWDGDGWVEDGKGDYSAGLIGIDGPAVRSLRIALGIRD